MRGRTDWITGGHGSPPFSFTLDNQHSSGILAKRRVSGDTIPGADGKPVNRAVAVTKPLLRAGMGDGRSRNKAWRR